MTLMEADNKMTWEMDRMVSFSSPTKSVRSPTCMDITVMQQYD